MTVSTTVSSVSYLANGTQTTFAYTFKIFEDSDLVVILRDAQGVETTQTLTTDYTVTSAGNDTGGNVVFGTAPASGNTVFIRRVLPITQTTDYVENDPFPAESHEDALDKLTMLIQQTGTDSDLALRFPDTDSGLGINNVLPTVANRQSQLLSFASDGSVQVTDPASLAQSIIGANYVVDNFTGTGSQTIFTLSAAPGSTNNTSVYIDGVYQEKANYSVNASTLTFTTAPPLNSAVEVVTGDAIPAGSATTASAVSYTASGTGAQVTNVQAKLREFASVKDFGAVGDGVTDDTAAITNALAASDNVIIPSGNYKVTSELTIAADKTLEFRGGGYITTTATIINRGNIVAGNVKIFHITDYTTNIRWLSGQPLNVTWYGAIGDDDVANASVNHKAFQVAFYSFKNGTELSDVYGTVYVPRGQYVINESIFHSNHSTSSDPNTSSINSRGVSIIGESYASAQLRMEGQGANFEMFKSQGGLAFAIRDLYFSTNNGTDAANMTTTAIRIDKGANEVLISNIRIQNYEIGIKLNSVKDILIENCVIDGCYRYAILTENNGSCMVNNCDLFRNASSVALTAASQPDPAKNGVIASVNDGTDVGLFIKITNSHLGLLGSSSNLVFSEGTRGNGGIIMSNCRAAADSGGGEKNIVATSSDLYITNCNFQAFGFNLTSCTGHITNCRAGFSEITTPTNLRLEGIQFFFTSTLSSTNAITVNPGGETGGVLKIHNCTTLTKINTKRFIFAEELDYLSVKDNFGINVDNTGSTALHVSTSQNNAVVQFEGNTLDEGSDVGTGIFVDTDTTRRVLITGNDMSAATGTEISATGTYSADFIVDNNMTAALLP